MSAVREIPRWIGPEEYLEGELSSEVRHEYLAGAIYAMAGASEEHNLIAGDIFTELNIHLRGKKCRVFMNDMKAHLRLNNEDWTREVLPANGQTLRIPELDFSITLDAIYQRTAV